MRNADLPADRAAPVGPATPFLGREDEMRALLTGLEDAAQGRGRLFLVAGEPGVGKTRLADEFGDAAAARGANVLWGRCWEAGGAPAYWPWIQALRPHLRAAGSGTLLAELEAHSELGLLFPELAPPRANEPPISTDPDTARFRLFDSFATLLWKAGESAELVIVMDDIHAADASSLLLLRFVASELPRARLQLVCTYRDIDVDPRGSIGEALPELLREPAATRIRLTGLSRKDVAALIERATGAIPSARVVEAALRHTEGNPLFVGEAVGLLMSGDALTVEDLSSVPLVSQSTQDIIALRMSGLSQDCVELLEAASVLGREFPLDALGAIADLSPHDLLVRLEEARARRIIGPVPKSVTRLRFSHALVRDAVYERIPLPRRPSLHTSAGRALLRLHARDLGPHLTEIAAHFLAAAPAGGSDPAVEYSKRAAEWAMDQLAYEEAARLYRTAIAALDRSHSAAPMRRCDLLLALGEAHLRAGAFEEAKGVFLEAAEMARSMRLPEQFARAALGYGGRFVWMRAGNDRHLVALLEEALDTLGRDDSALRACLLARLAGGLRDQPDRSPRAEISRQALEMARRMGDLPTLCYALVSRYTANWGPESAEEQLGIAEELVDIAGGIGDRDREVEGHLLRVKALMALGDMPGVHAAMEASNRLATELKQPSQQWYAAVDRATLALFEGRFRAAERLSEDVYRLGKGALGLDPEVGYRLHLFILRKEQGCVEQVEELIRGSVDDYPWYPMFRCVLANLYATLERREQTRVVFSAVSENDFAALPRDNEWLFGVSFLAEVAEFLGDVDGALSLYDQLLPYADLNAYSPPELCTGSISRYLGILASVAGRWDEASRHFSDAIDANARMGALPWTAHTQHDFARMLLRTGDEARARDLLGGALDTATGLEMPMLAGRVSSLLQSIAPGDESSALQVFTLEGDYWRVTYDGRTIRIKDSKGIGYIHRLLSDPGREMHALDLAGSPVAHTSAGEILDARARADYLSRVEELRDEIADATQWGDGERAAHAEEEIEALSSELATAYGLGGRARRSGDVSERARKAVTNRIRDGIARIGKENPALARHLSNSVRTGTFCSYSPDRPIGWRV